MKISEKYESFDEEKVENIVKELIESGQIFSVGRHRRLYYKIQIVATNLKMEYKRTRMIITILLGIGVILFILTYTMTNYALDDLIYSTPMKSEHWLVIWSYLSMVETFIFLILLPILYLRNFKIIFFCQEEVKKTFKFQSI